MILPLFDPFFSYYPTSLLFEVFVTGPLRKDSSIKSVRVPALLLWKTLYPRSTLVTEHRPPHGTQSSLKPKRLLHLFGHSDLSSFVLSSFVHPCFIFSFRLVSCPKPFCRLSNLSLHRPRSHVKFYQGRPTVQILPSLLLFSLYNTKPDYTTVPDYTAVPTVLLSYPSNII